MVVQELVRSVMLIGKKCGFGIAQRPRDYEDSTAAMRIFSGFVFGSCLASCALPL